MEKLKSAVKCSKVSSMAPNSTLNRRKVQIFFKEYTDLPSKIIWQHWL